MSETILTVKISQWRFWEDYDIEIHGVRFQGRGRVKITSASVNVTVNNIAVRRGVLNFNNLSLGFSGKEK